MTGISLPGKDCLPPGPHRALVEALYRLYEGAGKPSLRRIAAGITNGDFPDTVSHEKVGALLRGDGLPAWLKVECVVRQLAAWHNPRLDPDEEAARFTVLWLAADRLRRARGSRPLIPAARVSFPVAGSRAGAEAAETTEGCATSDFPCGPGLPLVVRGRDEILRRLFLGLEPWHSPGRPQVLAGPAGMGKSTIARSLADMAWRGGLEQRAWWVCAADEERLCRDLAKVARSLGVGEADWARLGTSPVANLGDVADRLWEKVELQRPGWLLVIDNADDPGLLGTQDGTGWIRRNTRGLLLITSRDADTGSWPGADLIRVGPLAPAAAAQVLTDLAPAAGDRTAAQALAKRLGYVPLTLRLAGMHLREDFGSGRTFAEYEHALDQADTPELSLNDLGLAGFPQARPLLWVLACYAPSSFILEEIIAGRPVLPSSPQLPATGSHPLARLLDPDQALPAVSPAEWCNAGLKALESAGLIERSRSEDGLRVIRVHAAICEETRTVMDSGPVLEGVPEPALARSSAASAACGFARSLDAGSAEDWPSFRILTPHVEELLQHATHLGQRARRNLLTCMVRCIAAHIWSKAEPRAEQLALRAMTLAANLGCHDQDVLGLRHVHAWARREQGSPAEAATAFQDILARQLQTKYAATRLDTLRTRQQLAWTLGRLGRWADAEEGLREVIRLLDDRRRHSGGAESRDARVLRLHARCMINWCCGRQGRWAEAEQGYRQLLTDREEIIGPDHPDTLDARYNIGKALAWQGKWAAAESEWRHTTADRAQALGDHHSDTLLARQLQLYASGYHAWQNRDQLGRRTAASGLEIVLSIQREKRGDDHHETTESRTLLEALRGHYTPDQTWPEDLPRPGTN